MRTRHEFARELAKLDLDHIDRAVALLWYYRKSGDYEERTAKELTNDLHDEGFPKPNVTRLRDYLQTSVFTIKGKRKETYQIDLRREKELDEKYNKIINLKIVEETDSILPREWVAKTNRRYLKEMIKQVNGSYDLGYFDACAVLCRRIMESLIVEAYLHVGKENEIKQADGRFLGLERLISKIISDPAFQLARSSKIMSDIKELGDTAAHDRVYITTYIDIDDVKIEYRKLIYKLLGLANILI